jgi:hypothetical protein
MNGHPEFSRRVFLDYLSKTEVAVIALIAEDEFAWAQAAIPELSDYHDYKAWREILEGYEAGLGMAGVEVRIVPVTVASFLEWCRRTKTTPSERSLETFAEQRCRLEHFSITLDSVPQAGNRVCWA